MKYFMDMLVTFFFSPNEFWTISKAADNCKIVGLNSSWFFLDLFNANWIFKLNTFVLHGICVIAFSSSIWIIVFCPVLFQFLFFFDDYKIDTFFLIIVNDNFLIKASFNFRTKISKEEDD